MNLNRLTKEPPSAIKLGKDTPIIKGEYAHRIYGELRYVLKILLVRKRGDRRLFPPKFRTKTMDYMRLRQRNVFHSDKTTPKTARHLVKETTALLFDAVRRRPRVVNYITTLQKSRNLHPNLPRHGEL